MGIGKKHLNHDLFKGNSLIKLNIREPITGG
jgi:hypothetical protein